MSSRRLLVYLVLGAVLCLGGIVAMFVGRLTGSITTQLGGIIVYAVSIPLLFQAKLTRTDARISALEKRVRELEPRTHSLSRPGENDEEEAAS